MLRTFILILLASFTLCSYSQRSAFETFISDSALIHASISFYVADADNSEVILDYDSGKSLIPASVMKLITSAAALELLGPEYTFTTKIGYSGVLKKRSGTLKGDIIITGGGDPALGSKYFSGHYQDFLASWVNEIKKSGIKKITGKIITDDSYFDFMPVPAKWLWEDTGNYYGAGAYGLSVFDNTYEIHLKTAADSTRPVINNFIPDECRFEFSNWLVASGVTDNGYVFAAPYSTNGWLAGTVPSDTEDFVLKASMTDPPLLIAQLLNKKLEASGIRISGNPTTIRLARRNPPALIVPIAQTDSPSLTQIVEVLNHESVNLFAEHLIKELGKKFKDIASTEAGVEVEKEFLQNAGINTDGMFIEDGSGLSPRNSINSKELGKLLIYMKNKGKYFSEYYSSLPSAGKEGTLKFYFMDPVFDSRLKAKSGSMKRVRSYAGYFTTLSGKNMLFSIIINNYTGPSQKIISGLEEIIKELISDK